MLKIELIGNLGADAEIKEGNGSKFVSFRVADTQKYKDQSGNEKEVTNWIDCTMSNVEAKVLPYLKAGVKVFVRGFASLRVYSSKKDRCMKAGLQVAVSEIELCGGSTDAVPRQVIDPATGSIYSVSKYYWAEMPKGMVKKGEQAELIDGRGNQYLVDHQGFIIPAPVQDDAATEENPDQTTQS